MGRLISIHPKTVYLVQDEAIDLIALATALPDDTAITVYRGVWNTDDTPSYRVTLGEIRAWCAAGKPMPPDRDDLSHQRQVIDQEPQYDGAHGYDGAEPTRDEINARMDRLREEKYRR